MLVGFALPEERPVQLDGARATRRNCWCRSNAFFRDAAASGELAQLVVDSSGDNRRFEYEESREFQSHVATACRSTATGSRQAAARTGIDWRLLAAVGYQESKWDPRAIGRRRRGVMMLTADTAQALGIKDRRDPEQSIFAGARYLAQVRAMIPKRIPEPDRTWLTLAAYNVGFGHLEDARMLTQALGKDPDSWGEVREQLPLLAQERWYPRVKRGYARGWEPVQFVDRIQRYLTLLEWQPGEPAPLRRAVAAQGACRAAAPLAPATSSRRARCRGSLSGSRQPRRCAKNSSQQPPALLHQHAAEYIDAVIEPGQREHIERTAGAARRADPRPRTPPAARAHARARRRT